MIAGGFFLELLALNKLSSIEGKINKKTKKQERIKSNLEIAINSLKKIVEIGTKPQGNTEECVIAYEALRKLEQNGIPLHIEKEKKSYAMLIEDGKVSFSTSNKK